MYIDVRIHVDRDAIPDEFWYPDDPSTWSTPEIGLLLIDGDGGRHWVETVTESSEQDPWDEDDT